MSERPKEYLLAIAIGPVQDFIAASRKARDLWFGSAMLSQLSSAAAHSLAFDADGRPRDDVRLIFPATTSLAAGHAVANKLLASTTADPQHLAAQAERAVTTTLTALWDDLRKRLAGVPAGAVDTALAREQLTDFLEWYAAWVPYVPGSYVAARHDVERLLAGRKALRDFRPATGRDLRPKSALDPSRESILDPTADQAAGLARRLHLKRSESLDAISLIKRLGGTSRFVSTARVAIDPFIRAAQSPSDASYALLQELADHAAILAGTDVAERFAAGPGSGLDHFAAFPFDSQLFYAPSAEGAIKDLEPWTSIAPSEDLIAAAKAFIGLVSQFRRALPGMGELPTYFAVLRADGDRMGAAISTLGSADAHVGFSEQLGTFATMAGDTVRKHHGAIIYSGGDDVLAFLPLDTALPCADALQRRFADVMAEALTDRHDVAPPTLSVGIAIGHYSDHLQHLLARSAAAERAAKGPRNALAVAFEARSGGGEARTVVHSWDDDPLRAYWAPAIEAHRHDALPDSAAYELARLQHEFADAGVAGVFGSDGASPLLHEVLVKETVRILDRKRAKRGTVPADQAVRDAIRNRLGAATPTGSGTLVALQSIVDELIIARRIAPLLPDAATTAIGIWNGALRPVEQPSNAGIRTEIQA